MALAEHCRLGDAGLEWRWAWSGAISHAPLPCQGESPIRSVRPVVSAALGRLSAERESWERMALRAALLYLIVTACEGCGGSLQPTTSGNPVAFGMGSWPASAEWLPLRGYTAGRN